MNFESQGVNENPAEKLKGLMGEAYNEMEMSDYLSYLSPEDASNEVVNFEQKLSGKDGADRSEMIELFKQHLRYKTTK